METEVARALRLSDRYLEEVVLPFGLCPWAERSLREGRVLRQVELGSEFNVAQTDAFATRLGEAGAVDIGLLIFPRARCASSAFDRFVESARQSLKASCPSGQPMPFFLAAFHPEAPAGLANPWQFVSFVRRTPHPTIQFVRSAVLDGVRAEHPGISDDVTMANFRRASADGGAALAAAIRRIHADRDTSA